jgi:hypothetical protein
MVFLEVVGEIRFMDHDRPDPEELISPLLRRWSRGLGSAPGVPAGTQGNEKAENDGSATNSDSGFRNGHKPVIKGYS